MALEVTWRHGIAQLSGTVRGRRVRQSTGTRDPEIAEQIRIATEARLVRADLYGPESEATFADAALLYLEAGKRRRHVALVQSGMVLPKSQSFASAVGPVA